MNRFAAFAVAVAALIALQFVEQEPIAVSSPVADEAAAPLAQSAAAAETQAVPGQMEPTTAQVPTTVPGSEPLSAGPDAVGVECEDNDIRREGGLVAEEAMLEEELFADYPTLAETVKRHAVQVRIYPRRDDGEAPIVADLAADLESERPGLFGGLLIAPDRVLMEDLMLHDRFLRRIEVAKGDVVVRARVESYLRQTPAVILKLEKPLPGGEPVPFAEAPAPEEAALLVAGWLRHEHAGGWTLALDPAAGGYRERLEESRPYFDVGGQGLLLDDLAQPVGFLFGTRFDPETPTNWQGTTLDQAPALSHADKVARQEALRQRLRQTALGVRFQFRSLVDEDGAERAVRQWRQRRSYLNDEETEAWATGFAISPNRLLIPVDFTRELIRRLESVTVIVPGADDQARPVLREATFVGALRDWEAILVEIDGEPLKDFLALGDAGSVGVDEIFLKAEVDYGTRRRRERMTYDRYRGTFRTRYGQPGLWTYTNEGDGFLAFDADGRLLALSLAQRARPNDQQTGQAEISAFRPAAVVKQALAAADAVDPTFQPVPEEEEKRLVALGVEWQSMDVNLARMLGASRPTRGGQIGLLVLHVYPGTEAEKAGLQEEDVLLRLHAPDRAEPIELNGGFGGGYAFGGGYMMDGMMGGFMDQALPPWPSRRNALTQLLTEIGEGKSIRVEYVRDGQIKEFTFTTGKGPADFDSAPKWKSETLGLTVRELTHEVRRFFRRPEAGGVVIGKIEPGGRAEVAGLVPFHLITHVAGQPVQDLEQFRSILQDLPEDQPVEMTLEFLGKTRLAKLGR